MIAFHGTGLGSHFGFLFGFFLYIFIFWLHFFYVTVTVTFVTQVELHHIVLCRLSLRTKRQRKFNVLGILLLKQ